MQVSHVQRPITLSSVQSWGGGQPALGDEH